MNIEKGIRKIIKAFFYQRRVFIRIQIIIISIITIMGAVIYFLLNTTIKQSIIKNFEDSSQMVLAEVSTSLDLIISNIMDVSKQIYQNENVDDFLVNGSFGKYDEELNEILKRVIDVQNSNRYIDSVYLYSKHNNLLVTSNYGITTIDSAFDSAFLEWFELPGNTIKVIKTHPIMKSLYGNYTFDVISIFTSLPITSPNYYDGVMVINIDQQYVYNRIINQLVTDNDSLFYVLDEEDNIIISRNKEDLYKSVYEVGGFNELLGSNKGSFSVNLNEEEYLLVYDTFDDREWKSVQLIPLNNVNQSIKSMQNSIMLTSLALFLINLLVCTIIILKQTKPIDDMITYIDTTVITDHISKNSKEVYDKLKIAFHDSDEMKKRIIEAMPLLRERFLVSLINGASLSDADFDERQKMYSLEIDKDNIYVCILQIDNLDEYMLNNNLSSDILIYTLINIINNKYGKDQNYKCVGVYTDISEIVLLINPGNIKVNQIVSRIELVKKEIKRRFGLTVVANFCDIKVNYKQIRQAYKKAKEIARYRIFHRESTIYYSDYSNGDNNRYLYPFDKEEKLKNYIHLNDIENAKIITTEFLNDADKYNDHKNLLMVLTQFNSALIRMADELNVPMGSIFDDSNFVKRLFEIKSIETAKDFFYNIIEKIIESIKEMRHTKISSYYMKITEYINENYYNGYLSLDIASENIGISPSYINHVLHTVGNTTFVHMLNEVRIRNACELLRNTDLKIQEIAHDVGFTSSKYFISVFKKIVGGTPGQYRK